MLRSGGHDSKLCTAADSLIRQWESALNLPTAPPTLPAPREYIDLLSGVIRVRYPGGGVWELPVVSHEFGHYSSTKLRANRETGKDVKSLIDLERSKKRYLGAFADELFADVFAAYVLGPAYAYTSLAARFDPRRAHVDGLPTHPKPILRARAMRASLDRLLGHASGQELSMLKAIVEDLDDVWHQALLGAGQPVEPTTDEREYVDGLTRQFLEILDAEFPAVRFSQSLRAAHLGSEIDRVGEPLVKAGDNLATALNAGWIARRNAELKGDGKTLEQITEAVWKLCQQLM